MVKKGKAEKDAFSELADVFAQTEKAPLEANKENPKVTVKEERTLTIEEPSPTEKPENFIANLKRFKMFLDVVKGKATIQGRLKPLLDPVNLQTTSRLNTSEVDFVTDAHWLASQWDEFKPLKTFAVELCETVISEGGKGRQEAISFMGATLESKLLKSLMFSTEAPKKRFPHLRREGEGEESK